MNETERKALVDELAAAMLPAYHGDLATTAYMVRDAYRKQATACLPVIDRLLAAANAPGLDELLDSVHNLEISETNKEGEYYAYGGMRWFDATADVRVYQDDNRSPDARYEVYTGTGTTRMDAIRNAVAQATATQEGVEGK